MMIGGLASLATAGSKGSDMKVAARVAVPKIIAVRIRHDMCPFCKKFDPHFSEVVQNASDESVLFVTLDLSTAATQQQGTRCLMPGSQAGFTLHELIVVIAILGVLNEALLGFYFLLRHYLARAGASSQARRHRVQPAGRGPERG